MRFRFLSNGRIARFAYVDMLRTRVRPVNVALDDFLAADVADLVIPASFDKFHRFEVKWLAAIGNVKGRAVDVHAGKTAVWSKDPLLEMTGDNRRPRLLIDRGLREAIAFSKRSCQSPLGSNECRAHAAIVDLRGPATEQWLFFKRHRCCEIEPIFLRFFESIGNRFEKLLKFIRLAKRIEDGVAIDRRTFGQTESHGRS